LRSIPARGPAIACRLVQGFLRLFYSESSGVAGQNSSGWSTGRILLPSSPAIEDFVVAGQPSLRPARTQAWLFWQSERLIFAFKCRDDEILAAAPSAREHDVDRQDRVELFLWSGNPKDAYLCLEIGARGAVHDYKGKFYRAV
jgi:hypothetical protein